MKKKAKNSVEVGTRKAQVVGVSDVDASKSQESDYERPKKTKEVWIITFI